MSNSKEHRGLRPVRQEHPVFIKVSEAIWMEWSYGRAGLSRNRKYQDATLFVGYEDAPYVESNRVTLELKAPSAVDADAISSFSSEEHLPLFDGAVLEKFAEAPVASGPYS
jgi:hypothetical protein